MHDGSVLYVAFDVDDVTDDDALDRVHVALDTNHNGLDPDSSDRLYGIDRLGGLQAFAGLGSNSDGLDWPPLLTSSAVIALASAAGRYAAEFAIPLGELGADGCGTVGIALASENPSAAQPWASYPGGALLADALHYFVRGRPLFEF